MWKFRNATLPAYCSQIFSCPEFSSYIENFWNFEFPIFKEFFFLNFKFTIVPYLWGNLKTQLSGKRKVEQNGVMGHLGLVGSSSTLIYGVPLALWRSRQFLGHSVHLYLFFGNYDFQNHWKCCISYTSILLQPNFLQLFRLTVNIKENFGGILKFRI